MHTLTTRGSLRIPIQGTGDEPGVKRPLVVFRHNMLKHIGDVSSFAIRPKVLSGGARGHKGMNQAGPGMLNSQGDGRCSHAEACLAWLL